MLESDPSFTCFTLDGQAIVLEDYLDVRPENESRLRALLAAGRLEVGPSYMLPDELLVGAEPLVRNLLTGRAVCERYGARPAPVGYMPDSFGHPLQLPQILAGLRDRQLHLLARAGRRAGRRRRRVPVALARRQRGARVPAAPPIRQLLVGDADDAQARIEEIARAVRHRHCAAPA